MFYQSYILPCIDYGSITWGSASSNIKRLNKLQKRAAQIILRTDFNTPSQQMFQELGWSPVPNRINYSFTNQVHYMKLQKLKNISLKAVMFLQQKQKKSV